MNRVTVNLPVVGTAFVCFRRHVAATRAAPLAFALALLWCLSCLSPASAANPSADDKKAAEQASTAPRAPIPLAEINTQAEAATIVLREIATATAAGDTLAPIEKALPSLSREIDARSRENARIVAQRPSLELLRTLERGWQTTRAPLDAWSARLEARIAALDRHLSRLGEIDGTWQATLALARNESAPAELIARVDLLLGSAARTRKTVEAERAQALRLQSLISSQTFRIEEAIELIRQTRDVTLGRVFSRDSPALWDRDAFSQVGARIAVDSQDARDAQWTTLRAYAERRGDRIALHLSVVLVLAALLYWARGRLIAWVKNEPELERAAAPKGSEASRIRSCDWNTNSVK